MAQVEPYRPAQLAQFDGAPGAGPPGGFGGSGDFGLPPGFGMPGGEPQGWPALEFDERLGGTQPSLEEILREFRRDEGWRFPQDRPAPEPPDQQSPGQQVPVRESPSREGPAPALTLRDPYEGLPERTVTQTPPVMVLPGKDDEEGPGAPREPHDPRFFIIGDPHVEPAVAPVPVAAPDGAEGIDGFFELPDPAGRPDERRLALLSIGTVLVVASNANGLSQACTGTLLGNGLVLTAFHCHEPKRGDLYGAFRVVTGEITAADRSNDRGVAAAPLPGLPDSARELDFLILKLAEELPPGYRASAASLSRRHPWSPFAEAEPLESILIWERSLPDPAFGKMRSTDDGCVALAGSCRTGRPGVLHGCDSTSGSSGAPIFLRGGHEVVAIHVAGDTPTNPFNKAADAPGRSNCALPLSEVYDALAAGAGDPLLETIRWVE